MKRFYGWIVSFSILLCLTGCPLPAIHQGSFEEPIINDVTAIVPGKTTKRELFERFGAPVAVAARDEDLTILGPRVFRGTGSLSNPYGIFYNIQSDTFFAPFSDDHMLTEYHRVYYYQHYLYSIRPNFWLLGVNSTGKTICDRLWVLVNEKSYLVEGFALRSIGKSGKSRNETLVK